jgi:4-hydroxybenzoate polyprenyltransferase
MKKLLYSKISDVISLLRLTHWLKNIFVFVPLVFSKNLFDSNQFYKSLLAFVVFSISSSIVYVINDLFDKKRDASHPIKKFRPIADNRISLASAILIVVLLFLSLLFFRNSFSKDFFLIISLYIGINFIYSIGLKQVVILDILFIASGFILRVIGGAFAIDVSVSSWLILSTLFLSLFLAVIKRKTELLLLADTSRKVLNDYSIEFIKQITSISAAGIIICYSLYTVSDRTINEFGTENLVFTTVFVVFGVFRYIFISEKKLLGENIIDALFKDYPSIINIIFYLVTVFLIIY